MNKLDVLLHPVRMRIIQTMMPNEELTVQDMAEKLHDVAPATLYRQVKKLVEAGVIEVREQQQVRGTVEKRYGLAKEAFHASPQDLQNLSKDEHMRYFTAFTAFLQSVYGRYLSSSQIDLEKDGVGYRYASVYLSDDEFQEWLHDYRALMAKAMEKTNQPQRKKRYIAYAIIPESP